VLVEWSVWALADRNAIFDYIEVDSPKTAVAVDIRIEKQVKALARFPEMGRPGRVEQTRELVIKRTPFIVAYRIAGSSVQILRVLRSAQQWPENMLDQE
jgi:toxin ParE1/3/4